MGRALVLLGLGIAALGLLIMLGLPLGRLPGDFYVRVSSSRSFSPSSAAERGGRHQITKLLNY
jgi:hypothetical protein